MKTLFMFRCDRIPVMLTCLGISADAAPEGASTFKLEIEEGIRMNSCIRSQ